MAARLTSTSRSVISGAGSFSSSSAGVSSGRTRAMRVSSMRVVSWVVWSWAEVMACRRGGGRAGCQVVSGWSAQHR